MTARIIDGKAHAAALRSRIKAAVPAFEARTGRVPGLAVVLVGEDPASGVYVRSKGRATREAGFVSVEHVLPASITEAELLALVARLNNDPAVDGILVQLPLPPHIREEAVIDGLDPAKDVDGFHPANRGRLVVGNADLVACTPLGCLILARTIHESLAGLEAVVIGRSNIVGKPVAQLLIQADATVTVAHSRTRDLAAVTRRADVLVTAIGRPGFVRGDWIKPGATVIDVGINRVEADGQKPRLTGDVAFEEACERAGAITPVPGGVGPMTIACLLANTLIAAHARAGLERPALSAALP
jgi:methylenetetrahydrofolate dehydrogenase (NADP+)/methenyltetrahydrofolate cyclohydrolase